MIENLDLIRVATFLTSFDRFLYILRNFEYNNLLKNKTGFLFNQSEN